MRAIIVLFTKTSTKKQIEKVLKQIFFYNFEQIKDVNTDKTKVFFAALYCLISDLYQFSSHALIFDETYFFLSFSELVIINQIETNIFQAFKSIFTDGNHKLANFLLNYQTCKQFFDDSAVWLVRHKIVKFF